MLSKAADRNADDNGPGTHLPEHDNIRGREYFE
jgi:hypothetical protein